MSEERKAIEFNAVVHKIGDLVAVWNPLTRKADIFGEVVWAVGSTIGGQTVEVKCPTCHHTTMKNSRLVWPLPPEETVPPEAKLQQKPPRPMELIEKTLQETPHAYVEAFPDGPCQRCGQPKETHK